MRIFAAIYRKTMHRTIITAIITAMMWTGGIHLPEPVTENENTAREAPLHPIETMYHDMQLDNVVSYEAFLKAVEGFNRIEQKKKNILTLIDFTRPSTEQRLCVIDMDRRKVLYTSVVAHGRNSGGNYATSFSNKEGSYKSSLGFYLTENTYNGKNGYSLVLEGLEKGINDKARARAIVVHGAAYADPANTAGGRLGRSLGCPALPRAIARPVIDTIKEGSVLFIYADSREYLTATTILRDKDDTQRNTL